MNSRMCFRRHRQTLNSSIRIREEGFGFRVLTGRWRSVSFPCFGEEKMYLQKEPGMAITIPSV